LLERLDALGELKEAFAANLCERQSQASRGAAGALKIASFDDNWPDQRVPTFQAGVVATAGFKIRRCQADPECEW